MLFNSYAFLLFLPVVFTIYWLTGRKTGWQNFFVVLSSYFFYACWDWRFLSLIFLTTISSYAAGRLMGRDGMTPCVRKTVNVLNIVLNVGILCVFKYLGFFAESFGRLLYNQIRLNPHDHHVLCSLFGTSRVYDFSGPNRWNADYRLYYEDSHYIPAVARQMMDTIYSTNILP